MGKIKLSAEQRADLEAREQDMVDAREALDKLSELGVDVKKMEARLIETERVREGLLREF